VTSVAGIKISQSKKSSSDQGKARYFTVVNYCKNQTHKETRNEEVCPCNFGQNINLDFMISSNLHSSTHLCFGSTDDLECPLSSVFLAHKTPPHKHFITQLPLLTPIRHTGEIFSLLGRQSFPEEEPQLYKFRDL